MPAIFKQENEFIDFVEAKATELYPESAWNSASALVSGLLSFEHNLMSSNVFDTCFQERPELFEGINWINSEEDIPLLIRPGFDDQWEAQNLYDDDDDDDDYSVNED